MTKRKILALFLALIMLISIFPATVFAVSLDFFSDGNGSETDPYTISNLEQLTAFRNSVNKGYDYSGTFIKLDADINLGGCETNKWTPIGTKDFGEDGTPFSGTFDGDGHTISGLYINETDRAKQNQGFFGYNKGTIKNLGIDGSITANVKCKGGIVGRNEGTVSDCYNSASVSGSLETTGGIVGANYGTIQQCFNMGAISCDINVGGIAGYNYQSGGVIKNCYNIGSITGNSESSTRIGGIVGINEATVEYCYNIGSVTGENTATGGIAGESSGTVTYCYYNSSSCSNSNSIGNQHSHWSSEDEFDNWDFTNIWMIDDSICSRPLLRTNNFYNREQSTTYTITNRTELISFRDSVNNGKDYSGNLIKLAADIDLDGSEANQWTPIGPSADKPFKGTFDGNGHKISGLYINSTAKYVGLFGYVGENGTIKNLGVDGTVKQTTTAENDEVYSSDTTDYEFNIGAIAGMLYKAYLQRCYSTADISGSVTGTADKRFYANIGGLVGTSYGTIEECYNTGNVYGETNRDSDSTYLRIGGIYGNSSGRSCNGLILKNCYNTGDITFNIIKSGNLYAGGVAGIASINATANCYNTGNMIDMSSPSLSLVNGVIGGGDYTKCTGCYYLVETPPMSTTDTYNIPKTFDYFAKQETFTDWDFTDTWVMDDSFCGRPLLKNNIEITGLETSPYTISNLEQLTAFRNSVNNGNDYNGKFIKLAATIDLEGDADNQWTPIGTADKPFSGTFDGDGYKIGRLFINGSNDANQGFFGYNKGTIKNLGILYSAITSSGSNVGSIAGTNSGKIENCYCYNNVTISGNSYVGGLVGINLTDAQITNCYNIGTVTSDANFGGISGSDDGTITNCFYLDSCNGSSDKDFTVTNSTSKTDEQFKSGEVAYLLQNGNTSQVWGQTLNETSKDEYPGLSTDNAKAVHKITYMSNENSDTYSEFATNYANDGSVSFLDPENENFRYWSETENGTKISAYTLNGNDVTFYGVYKKVPNITVNSDNLKNVYNVTTIDVSNLFSGIPDGSTATYSIDTESTGTGTVNDSTLTAETSGAFKINITTSATDEYCSGSQTVTLKVAIPEPLEQKNFTLERGALWGDITETNSYKYVYYGTYDNQPIKWRILATDGSGNSATYKDIENNTVTNSNVMFLLSEYLLKNMPYDADGQVNTEKTDPYSWRYSDPWKWCNDTEDENSFIYGSFTADEKKYLLKTTKSSSGKNNDELIDDIFYLLSIDEVQNDYIKDYRDATFLNTSTDDNSWWLRSGLSEQVYLINSKGDINPSPFTYREESRDFSCAVRPAFNLKSNSILFTTFVTGKKINVGTLSANTDNTTGEYKLTMKDDGRQFNVAENTAKVDKGETVTFNYSEAKTGSNEYISAMIVDNKDEVLYYGQLKNVTDSTDKRGMFSFTVPSGLDYGTYKLRLFNEQINGDYATDFSSDFETAELNVVEKEKVSASFYKKSITSANTEEIIWSPVLEAFDATTDVHFVTKGYNNKDTEINGDYTYQWYKGDEPLSEAPTDAGTYTIKIQLGSTAKQSFILESTELTYTIKQLDLSTQSQIGIYPSGTCRYDGTKQWPETINVQYRSNELPTSEYTIEEIEGEDYISAGSPKFKVKGNGLNVIGEKDSSFNINKAELNLSEDTTHELNYDGQAITSDKLNLGTVENVQSIEITEWHNDNNGNPARGNIEAPINVGTYWAYIKYIPNDTNNYLTKYRMEKVVINPLNPTISDFTFTAPSDLTFDGTAKNATVATDKTGMGEITVKYYDESKNLLGNSPTTAGAYTVKIDVAEGTNYLAASDLTADDWTFTIAKGSSDVTVDTNPYIITYGDKLTLTAAVSKDSKARIAGADTVEFYSIGEGGGIDVVFLGSATAVYDDDTKTSGTATLEIDTTEKVLDIGNLMIVAEYGGSVNLNGSSSFNLAITLEPKEVGLDWNLENLIYDGTAKNVTATATGVASGDDVSVSVTGGTKTVSGDYTATATALTGNSAEYYKLPTEVTQAYTISPRTVELSWGTLSFDYDNSEKEASVEISNKVGEDEIILTLENNKGTNAGDYKAVVTAIDNSNYTLDGASDLEKDWVINPKDITDADIELGEALIYNGQEQKQTIKSVKIDGLDVTYDVSDDTKTNAGDYTLTLAGNGNFAGNATKPFAIAKLPIIVSWQNTENLVYDGTEKTVTAVLGNVQGEDIVNLTTEGTTSATGKGTYSASVTAVDNENYTLENGRNLIKEWSIAETTNSFTAPLEIEGWTYGENAKQPTAAANFGEVKFVYSTETDGGYTADVPTNAGTYYVKAVVDGTEDYSELASEPLGFVIEPKDITKADIELGEALIYNGQEQKQTITSVKIDGLDVTYDVSDNKGTNSGNYILTVTANGNFVGYATKPFDISPRTVELSWGTLSFDYDSNEKEASVEISNKVGEDKIILTLENNKGTNSGDYKAVVTAIDNSNYTLDGASDLEKDWVINPKDITNADIELGEALIYNGQEQKQTIKSVKIDGLDVTYDVSDDTKTNAGDYTLTVTGNGNFAGNATKPFAIAKLPIIVSWQNTENLVYDGTEKTVTAVLGNVQGEDIVNLTTEGTTSATGKGTYSASVTAVDNENYTLENGKNLTREWSIAETANSFTAPLEIEGWTYGENAKQPTAAANFGEVKFVYSTETDGGYTADVPTNAGTYYVKAVVDGTADYSELASEPLGFVIEPKTISCEIVLEKPVKGGIPQKLIETSEYTAVINWSPEVDGEFAKKTEYTAEIVISPKSNYTLIGISENGFILNGATSITNSANSGIVTAVFAITDGGGGSSGGGGGTPRFTIKFETNGGDVLASRSIAKNSTVSDLPQPTKEGFKFEGWYADKELTIAYSIDTPVTKSTTLYAKWSKDEVQTPSDDNKADEQKPQAGEWKNSFGDVKENDWFFENVKFVNENNLMSGTTNTTFEPNESLTRAMLVTILYRLSGEPSINKSVPFADVATDDYYTNAVAWAQQNGIVTGITETKFAPDENITREQIATIIYRYAKAMGYDVSVGENTNILSYADFDEISDYAIEGLQYAVGSGLIKGKTENTLNPQDNATRAEIAAVINRFVEINR